MIEEKDNEYLAAEEHQVQSVMDNMPDEEELIDLSELFRVFGDSTRIRILYVLMDHNMCVSDIAQILQLNQSAVSHQLRILKDAKLVKYKREGKAIFYGLDDDHVRTILSLGMEHITEGR
ncbi:MAG: metalloregulator ArsR/SmtB family transcription factor [Lachnospiraceae bacterium]|nr:metalloregulator ArsR/SmtB family transcription factor [Lachnospiraceae bacterium]